MNFTISLTGATSLVVSGIYRIANVFYKAGFVESWGKGTNNIIETCLKMGLPTPSYDYSFHSVNLTFYKTTQETTVDKNEGVNGGVNGGVNELLTLITVSPGNSSRQLVESLGVSQRTLERWLKQLKEDNKIEFRGAAKTGGYYAK